MKVLMINVCCGTGSTGRICTDLADALERRGHQVKIAYGRNPVPEKYQKYAIRVGGDVDVALHVVKARLFDDMGFGSKNATRTFIEWIKQYDPDVIHLHNIHGYYINAELLFNYLNCCGKKIIWTLHDCWSFTGHTPYCDVIGCEKWKTGCYRCKLSREYPKTLLDCSNRNWEKKHQLFTGIPKMTIITPSQWLQSLLAMSFLNMYPAYVINNGINTKAFYPKKSNILEKLEIKNKFVLLGVSSIWDHMKGLQDYSKLSQLLDDRFIMVLVGLTQKQIYRLPKQIIGLKKTESIDELAELYSAADVFLNLSYCENYPTVNIEALSCGTPILTYATGGSPEIVQKYGGVVVEKGDLKTVKRALMQMVHQKPEICFSAEDNDINTMIDGYIDIYESN